MCLKQCNKCKDPKDKSSFNKSARFEDGLYPTCRNCVSARRKELKVSPVLKIKTELRKITLLECRILKLDNLSQCHTCRTEIPLSKSNHYCHACEKLNRDKDKEKVLAQKKAYRDRNKEKQKEYRDSRKELTREYDARRYALRKKTKKENK